jgi:hypothetical protein
MGLAKIRFHSTTLLTILAFPTKGGGQVCEKAVFVKASNLYYIILPIKTFESDRHTSLGCSVSNWRATCMDYAQADKVALRA